MNLIDYISNHPKIAFIVGTSHIAASIWINTVEIPKIVMQSLQCGAWAITITVGLITIYGAFKKWRNKK